MRAPGALHLLAVHLVRAGPPLRGAQDDHRPQRTAGLAVLPRRPLDGCNLIEGIIERGRQLPVHIGGIMAGDGDRDVTVAAHQGVEFVGRDTGQHGRVGDLVAVEVQDRQHRAVTGGVEELIGMPAGGQRPGLGLAVPDDGGDHQVGVVEGRAEGVHQGVAQFAALVDGTRCLGRHVAGDAAGKGELPKQLPQALDVLTDAGVDLRVGALEVGVGHQSRPTVPGAGDVDDVGIALPDHPVQVRVQQVETRGGAPMPQ